MPRIWHIVCLSTPLYCLWSLPSVYPSVVYFNNSVNRGKQMANIPSQKAGVSLWHLSDMRGISEANPLASTTVLCHLVSSLVSCWFSKVKVTRFGFGTSGVHGLNLISLLRQFVQKKKICWEKTCFPSHLDTTKALMLLRSHCVIPCTWCAGWVVSENIGGSSGARREDLLWCLKMVLFFRCACLWACRTSWQFSVPDALHYFLIF